MHKTLVIIRHAKARSNDLFDKDFDRTLAERGIKESDNMGLFLKNNNCIPDLIIASASKRTTQTAQKIAIQTGYDVSKIQYENKLYHGMPIVFEEFINNTDNSIQTLFIVGHNPGITIFVNEIAPHQFKIDDLPTCGVIVAKIALEDWKDYKNASKSIYLVKYP